MKPYTETARFKKLAKEYNADMDKKFPPMKTKRSMKINFNNARRQSCIAYEKLVCDLSQCSTHEGYLLVDPESLEERLNDLRMMIGSVAMTFEEGNEDFKDVYQELYPGDKSMAEFSAESIEDEE